MSEKYKDIVLALAGILQASGLVNQLATTGECDDNYFEKSIKSVYALQSDDVPSIFGGVSGVRYGLYLLIDLLERDKEPEIFEITRYLLSLIKVERKLARNNNMLNTIRQRLEHVQTQINYFSEMHEKVISSIGQIYLDTISTFHFRIKIVGDINNLQDETTLMKIRALLLAGVRSAVLWRQLKGSRLQWFFNRHELISTAKSLLDYPEN